LVIAESIEDAKIWAADQTRVQQAAGPGHQYEMVARRPGTAQSLHNTHPYESLAGSVAGRAGTVPAPPSDASTVEAAMAHQVGGAGGRKIKRKNVFSVGISFI
jgi:hypothetical protein